MVEENNNSNLKLLEINCDSTNVTLVRERISKIADIEHLKKVEVMCLRWNMITKIENLECVSNSLTELDFSDNQIENIENLESLVNLQTLDLSYNRITQIKGLDNLLKLKTLFLTHNKIAKIDCLFKLTKLEHLELGDNRIENIENLDNNVNLQRLFLGANHIERIKNLDKLVNLNLLSLSCNGIQILEGLDNLVNLTQLSLCQNGIERIGNALKNNSKLQILDFNQNCLKLIEGVEHLENLTDFWASQNKLTNWSDLDVLAKLSKLSYVYLHSNPFSQDSSYRRRVIQALPQTTINWQMRSKKKVSLEEKSSDVVCYCNGLRQLGVLELNCIVCKRWFHRDCLKDLTEFYGLPFMVSYVYHCKDCSLEKKETWTLKQTNFSHMCIMAMANMTYNHFKSLCENDSSYPDINTACQQNQKYFSLENEIVPFFESNWENLTSMPRRVKNTWHQTLQRTLSKETDLFVTHEAEENTFGLKERNLLLIGPLHEAVKQLGKRPTQPQVIVDQPDKAYDPAVEGPKTRGASKRKTLETSLNNHFMKKNKSSASDFSSVQIEGLNNPVDFPFNREGYRYYLVEKDDMIPNRALFDVKDLTTSKSIPSHIYRVVNNPLVTISPNDRAHQLKLSEDRLSVTGFDGYCLARATHGVAHGSWYFEVDFLAQPDQSHVRIGWSQPYAVLQACLGYTKFSYSWRSRKGTVFHDARGIHYTDDGYKQGDTLGCLIELLPLGKNCMNDLFTYSDFLPSSYKDLALIDFKHNLFFEEKEEIQETFKNMKTLNGTRIEFFRNGKSCGTAFKDIYAGIYYPAVSIYRSATVRCNFGPKFKFRIPKDARGICERADEIHIEQALSDILYAVSNKDEIDKKTAEFFENE